MPSTRETALAALKTKLETVLSRTVERMPGVPIEFDGDDIVGMDDGTIETGDYIMGAAREWEIEHTVEVTFAVKGFDEAARLTAIDALMKAVGDALSAEGETLGGAVDQITVGAPGMVDFEQYGVESVTGKTLPLTLLYTAATPVS